MSLIILFPPLSLQHLDELQFPKGPSHARSWSATPSLTGPPKVKLPTLITFLIPPLLFRKTVKGFLITTLEASGTSIPTGECTS